jgi:hypothetical protein
MFTDLFTGMFIFAVALIATSLLLAGLITFFTRPRKPNPQCSCLEYMRDNPNCPVHPVTRKAMQASKYA